MAYAALVSLSQTIDQIWNHDELSISIDQTERITSIHEHVIFLQAFLEDFPEKVNTYLEGKIIDVTTEAEDVIEIVILMWKKQYQSCYGQWQHHQDLDELKKVAKKFDSISFRFKYIRYIITSMGTCVQLLHSVRRIFEGQQRNGRTTDRNHWSQKGAFAFVWLYIRLIQIFYAVIKVCQGAHRLLPFNKINEFDLTVDTAAAAASSSSSSSRLATSHKKDAMVGFDDDLLAIKERLCGQLSKLQVIPIVGMGGIGKTTLATNAYHDPLITGHFDIRAWITVSQDYSPQRILLSLLDSMKEFDTERCEQNNEVAVYQHLKGRRYLIVMDDIWSTKAWDDIMRIFPDDNNGRRIMLTTRLLDVATYADSCSHIHEMHLMDADQSWDLLHHKVFTHEVRCTLELENIGKEIARSCGGRPLAIVVIAGLLSTSITRASWQKIADKKGE